MNNFEIINQMMNY